jgi:putative peptidoglycan lipid II flippase
MKLIRYALSFALATFVSRVLGFLRDAAVAYYFGASQVSDAFFVAFRIPNSFRRILGEGGFNAAFVPMYVKALEERRGGEFLRKVFFFYLSVAGGVTLLGSLGSDLLIPLIAPGLRSTPTGELAVFMARFLFAYLFLIGLTAFFMGVLNAHGRFFVPAFSQAVFNGAFLLVLLLVAEFLGYKALILGVLAGGVLQVLVNLPSLLSSGVRLGFLVRVDGEVKTLAKRLVPALAGFGVSQMSIFIDTFLASFLRTGAISYLYYANRIYQLPFGMFSVGIANSLLALLPRRDTRRGESLTYAYRLVIILSLPSSVGLIVLSDSIVSAVYGRGSFTQSDVLSTSTVLSLYSLGLLFFSLQKVTTSSFFSKGDTVTPLKANLFSVLAEGLMASAFLFLLGLGLPGLPLATALSSLVGFGYLLIRLDARPHPGPVLSTLARSSLSTLVMVLFLLFLKGRLGGPLQEVLTLVPSGALLYFLCLLLLRDTLVLGLFEGFVKKLVKS